MARAGADFEKIKEWASQPWATNVEQIPGLEALKQNEEIFSSKLVTKFCSDTVSLSMLRMVEERKGFMMIHEGGFPTSSCGRYRYMGKENSAEDCIEAAQNAGWLAISYGKGRYANGRCWIEQMA